VTAPAAPGRQRSTGFTHRPGLDGLRGLAVAGVLAFHSGFSWAQGGFLGVSAFFTLSGFLITTLLLGEHASTGGVDLRAFWIRRFRRLLPAALLGVLVAAAYVLAFGDQVGLDRFRGDALAAIAYVANWRFVLSDLSYAELFQGDSPLQHFWSLAIEEQFYLVLPLVAVLALRRPGGPTRLAAIALTGLVASVALSLLVGGGDRAYYGTDTRMAELLIGVLLAIWHHRSDLGRSLSGGVRSSTGVVALAAMLGLWVVTDQQSAALHPWGLLVHAVLSAAIIVAVLEPTPVGRILSLGPLTALGRISYGVYVYHWPVFLWLTPERTGLDSASLAALRIAVTLALAIPSNHFIEQPIRYGRLRIGGRRTPVMAAGAVVAVTILAVVPVSLVEREPTIDFGAAEALQEQLLEQAARSSTTTTAPPPEVPSEEPDVTSPPGPPPRVALFGDSTALLFLPGLISWSEATGDLDLTGGYTQSGCGIGRGGTRNWLDQGDEQVPEGCNFDTAWIEPLALAQPDIAVVQVGLWDLVERQIPGDDQRRRIGDPVYDAFLTEEILVANELLLGTADRTVWVLQPPPVASTRQPGDPIFEAIPRYNRLLVDVLGDDARVGFIDMADWLAGTPDGTDSLRLRPDGTHFTRETSLELAAWLAPAILEAAESGAIVGGDDVEPVPIP